MSGFILTAYMAFFSSLLLLGGFLLWERRRVNRRLAQLGQTRETDDAP